MVRQYVQISDKKRNDLISIISTQNVSIARAAQILGIPYDNAKAINRTYQRERRITKIDYKERYNSRRTNVKNNNSRDDQTVSEPSKKSSVT